MRIKYFFILLFFIPFFSLVAQIDPQFTFFPWAAPFYNPATLGEGEKNLNLTGILRQTDMGMGPRMDQENPNDDPNNGNPNPLNPDPNNRDGKPPRNKQGGQKVLLNLDSYIKKIKGAVGVTFLKNQDAQQDNIGFGVGYAARLPVRRGKLGIGVQFGLLNQSKVGKSGSNNGTGTGIGTGSGSGTGTGTGFGKLDPIQPGDPTTIEFDQLESVLDFNMNFGLHYRTATWYVGVSGTQLLGGVRVSGAETSILSIPRQLYITGGYIWNLKTVVPWSIEPSLLIYTYFSNFTFSAMAIARYNGILWFGASYEHNSAISVLLGAVPFYNYPSDYLKGLELGVAFGFITKKYGWVKEGSWGNFELVVRYGFNFYKEKALSGYGSTRHLYKNQ